MAIDQSHDKTRKPSSSWRGGRMLVFVVLCILLSAISFLLDGAVIEWVRVHDSKWLKDFAGFLGRWGDWPELMLYGVIALGVSALAGKRQLGKLILCMMVAGTIAGALVNSVRLVSGRARPNNAEAAHEWNGLWDNRGNFLLFKNKYHSFPSGHTGCAFAFFSVPVFANRRIWWLLIPAVAVGWSRIYLNVHHFSDVFVAAMVGLFIAALVWKKSAGWIGWNY